MITEALDYYNRRRPEGYPVMRKKDLAEHLISKGMVTSYQGANQMFQRIDAKEQEKISIVILKEIADYLNITVSEIVNFY